MNRSANDILNDLIVLFPEIKPVIQQVMRKHDKQIQTLTENPKNEINTIKTELDSLKIEVLSILNELKSLQKLTQ